jgi:hypothetical protein
MIKESDKVVCVMDLKKFGNDVTDLYPTREYPEIGKIYCVTKTVQRDAYLCLYLVGFPQYGHGFPEGLFIELEEFKGLDKAHKKIYLGQ